jgi:hypothetical protein
MVFLNSPYRKTLKNVLTKKQGEKNRLVGGWVWDLANARGGPSIIFWRPLDEQRTRGRQKKTVTPWWVGGPRPKNDQVRLLFLIIFCGVFCLFFCLKNK